MSARCFYKLPEESLEVYQFLCSFFSATLLNPLSEGDFSKMKAKDFEWFAQTDSTAFKKGWSLLMSSLKTEAIEDIWADHTSLFLSSDKGIAAVPYGSFYLNKEGEMYTQETDEVAAIYMKSGFEMEALYEPEDHIGIEIGFVGVLLSVGLDKEAPEAYCKMIDGVLRHFLSHHLLPYATLVTKNIQRGAKTKFYAAIAYLIQDFLEHLQSVLRLTLKERKIFRLSC